MLGEQKWTPMLKRKGHPVLSWATDLPWSSVLGLGRGHQSSLGPWPCSVIMQLQPHSRIIGNRIPWGRDIYALGIGSGWVVVVAEQNQCKELTLPGCLLLQETSGEQTFLVVQATDSRAVTQLHNHSTLHKGVHIREPSWLL